MKVWITFCLGIIARSLHLLPRGAQLFLGDILGVLWFDILRIRRHVALDNLRRAFPGWSETDRVRTGRESLRCLGRSLIEYLLMLEFRPSDMNRYFEFEGLERLERVLSHNKGALVLSLHLGNGDFGCVGLSLQGIPISLISKQFKSQWLNDFWFDLRRKHGTQFIREEKSTYDILKALKDNRAVIFVLDQFMGPPVGVRTQFFGQETGTAFGLALFAERGETPVFPVYNFRRPDGKLQIVVGEPILFENQGDREQNKRVMTQRYTDEIEKLVRRYPGQWMWIHRRWKPFRE